jgi:hypothetical protein
VTDACIADGQSKLDNYALFHNVSFGTYGVAAAAGLGLGLYLGLLPTSRRVTSRRRRFPGSGPVLWAPLWSEPSDGRVADEAGPRTAGALALPTKTVPVGEQPPLLPAIE